MGISLCMIVRNEEDWVDGAVQSVRSIASEVIIADTGSSDSTHRRVKALADKALKIGWNGSCADARNSTLSEASEPWILVLDGDERIATKDLPLLNQAINGNAADGRYLTQRDYLFGNHVLGWAANESEYEEGESKIFLYWAISEKNLRQYDSASGLLTRALRLGLDTFEVRFELGNVFLAQNELTKARSEYAKCLAIQSNDPVALEKISKLN